MKNLLVILCLLNITLLAQESVQSEYTNAEKDSATGSFMGNNYTRYVGGGEKNYPLTIAGLQGAMASLDSGQIYISYPGLWDTVGLGAIPTKINLRGYLFGDLTWRLYDSLHIATKGFRLYDRIESYSALYNQWSSDFNQNLIIGSRESYDPVFTAVNIITPTLSIINSGTWAMAAAAVTIVNSKSATANYTSLKSLGVSVIVDNDSTTYNKTNAFITGQTIGMTYKQSYQPNVISQIAGLEQYYDFTNGSDTINATSGVKGIFSRTGTLGTGLYLKTNYYSFYSTISASLAAKMITGYTAYHYYAENNYPSYFGGTVNSGAGYNYAADAQANDSYVITLDGAHALTAGLEVTFKANTANTDGATLTVNSLTATAITKCASGAVNTALATGDILAGQIVKCVYDGTQFQIISRLAQ